MRGNDNTNKGGVAAEDAAVALVGYVEVAGRIDEQAHGMAEAGLRGLIDISGGEVAERGGGTGLCGAPHQGAAIPGCLIC